MADIEKFEEFPEDFELTEADLANFDPDDPSFDDSFNDEIPAELRDEGILDIPVSSSKDSLAPDSIDAPVSNTSVKTVTDATQQLKEPVEQFEEFNVDYSIEDDTFELDDEEVSPLPNEEKFTVTSQKTDRKPGEVEDGELDGCPTNSAKRNSEFKPNPAQGPNSYRPRNNYGKNNLQNQRRAIPNHDGFQPGMRYMPYPPVNGNPRVNGMMPGMGPFPGGGNIHVNPNFRGFQQRPPFPMNPISPFGMPMMGMQPWGMNGGGYNGIRPGFGMEFNHNQGKPSDLKNPMPKKTIPVTRNRDQRPGNTLTLTIIHSSLETP
ncbi:hypothetical protein K7432_003239 [Basidiobolus ranarum]|uniref:Uncharacterized protein n=1 Tax=Basidiobolus ranarum TaxID=34480 RepID=A0ABR2W6J3_9FUNG